MELRRGVPIVKVSKDADKFPDVEVPDVDTLWLTANMVWTSCGKVLPSVYDGRLSPIQGPTVLVDEDDYFPFDHISSITQLSAFEVWPEDTPNWVTPCPVHICSNKSPYAYWPKPTLHPFSQWPAHLEPIPGTDFWPVLWRSAQLRDYRIELYSNELIMDTLLLSDKDPEELVALDHPDEILDWAGWTAGHTRGLSTDHLNACLINPVDAVDTALLHEPSAWPQYIVRIPFDNQHPLDLGLSSEQIMTHPYVLLCFVRWRLAYPSLW
ncbi:NS4 [Hirame aquareovirus]|nr:NS4 [Hirame aquareovirus]